MRLGLFLRRLGATPDRWTETPDHRGSAPDRRTETPGHRGSPPGRRTVSPGHRGSPPDRRTVTPDYRGSTPARRTVTPGHRGSPPDRRTMTPDHRGSTPDRRGSTPARWREPSARPAVPSSRWREPRFVGGRSKTVRRPHRQIPKALPARRPRAQFITAINGTSTNSHAVATSHAESSIARFSAPKARTMTAWGFASRLRSNPRTRTACACEALKARLMECGVVHAKDVGPA